MVEIVTRSPEETRDLGRRVGERAPAGAVLALVGDLGAGKTQFVKGVAVGLGVADADIVTSPTFVLLNRYSGRVPILHYDLYRTEGEDLETLGFHDFRRESVTLIEWAERARGLVEDLRVEFQVAGETSRRIRFLPRGPAGDRLLASMNLSAGNTLV